MSYHCTIGKGLEIRPCEPYILCDICGVKRLIVTSRNRRTGPPVWFMNGKPPPKWKRVPTTDGQRCEWCPACTALMKNKEGLTTKG